MWPLVNSRNRSVYKGIKKIIWYREKMKNRVWKDTCIPGFITALFITGKIWKQPKCPSTDERIKTTRRWALCVYVCVFVDGVQSVMSDSLRPHGLYSPPASSVHGISQARILEWIAVSSWGSSQPRDLCLLNWLVCSLSLSLQGSPMYKRTSLSHKKEWNNVINSNTDGPRDCRMK